MKFIKNWLLPLTIAAAIFFIVRPVFAQVTETPHDVTAGTVSGNEGFSQIYYEYNGSRITITNTRYTNSVPAATGEYIVWNGQINGNWQVFLYNLATGVTTQLTYTGNNLNPKVNSNGQVTWEGWTNDTWQVFFFDGSVIQQLTVGDTSLNPEISGDYISYGRRNSAGSWRAVVYSLTDKKSVDVTTGETSRKPKIDKDGNILLGENSEKFSLKASDLFLLDLPSIEESTPSADPILEELTASPSGVPEIVTNL